MSGLRIRSREILEDEESETVQYVTDDLTALSPGEPIVYSITHEVTYDQGEKMWVKFGSSTEVRPGETPLAARSRLVNYVHNQIGQSIKDAMSHAKSITE